MKFLIEPSDGDLQRMDLFGVQVGRMGCIPACGHNVLCSQPSLHCQGAPLGRGAL